MNPIMATILLLGLALGILYRTYAPYHRKEKAGKISGFDTAYIWTALIALVGAVMSALTIFPEASMALEGWPLGTGYGATLAFGFIWAVGWNYGTNEAFKPRPVIIDNGGKIV